MGRAGDLEIEHHNFACPVVGQTVTIKMQFRSLKGNFGQLAERANFGNDCLSKLTCPEVAGRHATGGQGVVFNWSKCACPAMNRQAG